MKPTWRTERWQKVYEINLYTSTLELNEKLTLAQYVGEQDRNRILLNSQSIFNHVWIPWRSINVNFWSLLFFFLSTPVSVKQLHNSPKIGCDVAPLISYLFFNIQEQFRGSSDPSPQSWSPSQNHLLGMQRPLWQGNWDDEQLAGGGDVVGAKTRINKQLRVSFILRFLSHLADQMTGKDTRQKIHCRI